MFPAGSRSPVTMLTAVADGYASCFICTWSSILFHLQTLAGISEFLLGDFKPANTRLAFFNLLFDE